MAGKRAATLPFREGSNEVASFIAVGLIVKFIELKGVQVYF